MNKALSFGKLVCLTTALVGSALLAAPARAADPSNLLYVESNNPASGQNAVIGYQRLLDGTLKLLPGSPFLTGGTGLYNLANGAIFDGDNIMVYDRFNRTLYVPNGGSNTIADGTCGSCESAHAAVLGMVSQL